MDVWRQVPGSTGSVHYALKEMYGSVVVVVANRSPRVQAVMLDCTNLDVEIMATPSRLVSHNLVRASLKASTTHVVAVLPVLPVDGVRLEMIEPFDVPDEDGVRLATVTSDAVDEWLSSRTGKS